MRLIYTIAPQEKPPSGPILRRFNFQKFIEKPREFIEIFRNSLFSNAAMRFAIIHARVLSPITAIAGKCVSAPAGLGFDFYAPAKPLRNL